MSDENVIHSPAPFVPVSEGTAGKQLYDALVRYQNLPEALIDAHTHEVISFKTLLEMSCRLAQSLCRCGFTISTVLAICSENSLPYHYPILAALYLGIAVQPLSPEYTEDELNRLISIARPKIIFCSKRTIEKMLSVKAKFAFIQKIIIMDSEEHKEAESLHKFITHYSDTDFDVKRFKPTNFDGNHQIALVMASSGTTGLPKGVMLTHKNICHRFAQCKDPIYGTITIPGSTALNFLPLFHAYGLNITLGFLIVGVRIVVMKKFDGELFLRSIQNYKVNSVYIVPAIVTFIAKHPLASKYDLSSLQDVGSGAAPLSKEVSDAALKHLVNVKGIRDGYGLTEGTLALIFMPKNQSKIGSIGKVMPFLSVKIIDIDSGKALGPNQTGEIYVKGGLIMKGYIGNPIESRKIIDEDGWLHTGDYGYYDEEEFFYVAGRIKELIKYKGFQVPPAELEGILVQHPKIKDAGVVGIPDEIAGELPGAFVVKQPGVDITDQEIVEYVASKVSHQKHLRGGVRFIDEVPRNPSGKILRKALKEMIEKKKSNL